MAAEMTKDNESGNRGLGIEDAVELERNCAIDNDDAVCRGCMTFRMTRSRSG